MKQARETILLVGHGSRDPEGNQEAKKLMEHWASRQPDQDVMICFLEFSEVSLPRGLAEAAHNSDRVIILPLFLNAAGHVKQGIPEHIAEARRNLPNVTFHLARHLGGGDAMLALLRMRLHSAMRSLAMADPVTTGVILLGRGSSEKSANGEIANMAHWILETTQHHQVDYAFTSIAHPRLESVMQRQTSSGITQIVVLPYYLFTGRLMHRIGEQVKRLRHQYPTVAITQARHLGIDDRISDIMDHRIAEVRKNSASTSMCDGCSFLTLADSGINRTGGESSPTPPIMKVEKRDFHGNHHHDHHHHGCRHRGGRV